MKILVYTIPPIYAKKIHGGAQNILMNLIKGITEHGHEVYVLCSKYNCIKPYQMVKKGYVYPLLNTNPYCDYDLTLEQIIENNKILRRFTEEVDIILSIDREFPIYTQKPILLILSTLAYYFNVKALLSLNYNRIVVPTHYLYKMIKFILSVKERNLSEFCKVILNGLDYTFYSPTTEFYPIFDKYKNSIKIIFPHRADERKGFKKAIDALSHIIKQHYDAYLFIPIQDFFISDKNFYDKLFSYSQKQGISNRIIFHKWIPLEDLPIYLSSGDVILNLSTLAEGFGLIVYESILCNTPVITTKCGALRDIVGEIGGIWWLDHDYAMNDLLAVFDNALDNKNTVFRGREIIISRHSYSLMINEYLNEIEGLALESDKLKLYQARGENIVSFKSIRKLPPWCYITNKGRLYNDITGQLYDLEDYYKKEDFVKRLIEQDFLMNISEAREVRK